MDFSYQLGISLFLATAALLVGTIIGIDRPVFYIHLLNSLLITFPIYVIRNQLRDLNPA